MNNKIYFESLGCSKNLIDAEVMMELLIQHNFSITDQIEEAKIAVINTCGFIESAKEESIQHILSAATHKEGKLAKLIVTGCLAERYQSELLREMPEIDALLGTGRYEEIVELVKGPVNSQEKVRAGNISNPYNEKIGRFRTTPDYMAYVKIAEGCDNHCTYCIIPKIRGKYRSRKMADIVKEVQQLVDSGVKEIVLIAQDTTAYGIDLYNDFKLPELLEKLNKIENLQWIRILYCYPERITSALIDVIKNSDKVCKYLDIPLQHSEDSVLKCMNRSVRKSEIYSLIQKLRHEVKGIALRTTLIVGFPGEKSSDFEQLKNFIYEMKFDKLGVFSYSQEEGTAAAAMDNQIPDNIKEERKNEIMKIQQDISAELLKMKVGSVIKVLIEEKLTDENESLEYIGRSEYDAPEIDGSVYVTSSHEIEIGSIIDVRINGALEYDLMGEALNET
ncbi:30S ribosomal protein S12 methylthiotransferase RimO [Tindallia californiensis]|uniref:Ribosomal protein uS12 methylthiotransferase RimO n=1 Tax=Tindallia californiensis TaxID=159292 RepID=A0A1H3NQE5_9FIRM|nr:30S ribosomal protein S12 methylthiotransferase RimO [Tindallia californiensis]SDY90389.1 SSU ribosomal protein S12P methylthiotransferase [Tindallia californiensis]